MAELSICIDLGATKCAGACINRNGDAGPSKTVLLGNKKGKEVGQLLLGLIEDLLHSQKTSDTIKGIGISIPGIYKKDKGTVWAPNIMEWEDFPLYKLVSQYPSFKKLPVFIDSDRACSVIGETWLGSSRGKKNVIFLAVGTGIGAGILVDGQIIRGVNDSAGAIGWLALQKPFDEKYSNFGCFEYYASGDGLERAAREFIPELNLSLNKDLSSKKLKAENLFDGLRNNDPLSTKVISQAIEFWGMAAANLVSLFNPEVVVFGGGIFGPAVSFLDNIYNEAKKWAQPIAIQNVQFLASSLKGKAQLFGSAALVFHPHFKFFENEK